MNVVGDLFGPARCSAAGGEIRRVMKKAVAYLQPFMEAEKKGAAEYIRTPEKF